MSKTRLMKMYVVLVLEDSVGGLSGIYVIVIAVGLRDCIFNSVRPCVVYTGYL